MKYTIQAIIVGLLSSCFVELGNRPPKENSGNSENLKLSISGMSHPDVSHLYITVESVSLYENSESGKGFEVKIVEVLFLKKHSPPKV